MQNSKEPRENDGDIFSGHVDSFEDMGELANDSFREVEVCRAQSRPSIEYTTEVGIEKGSVVLLGREADLGSVGIDVALPNVI